LFSAGFRLTHFDAGVRHSELRLDAVAGSNMMLGLEYFLPIGRSGLFVEPRAFVASDRMDVYQSGHRTAEYLVVNTGAGLDAGYIFGRSARIRAGYQVGRQDADIDAGVAVLPDVAGLLSAASAEFVYDGLDHAVVPERGLRAASEFSWYLDSPGAPAPFPLAELSLDGYAPLGRNGVMFARASGGTTFKKQPGPAQQFMLGGPLRLSAYGLGEFRGNHYLLGSAGYRHRLGALPTLFGGNVYGLIWYERGSAFFRRSDAVYRQDAAAALLLDTLLGPLVFGGALGDPSESKIFFSLGRFF
jgi:NTE family protein